MKAVDGSKLLHEYHTTGYSLQSRIKRFTSSIVRTSPMIIYLVTLILTLPIYLYSVGFGIMMDLVFTIIYIGLQYPSNGKVVHPILQGFGCKDGDLVNVNLSGKSLSYKCFKGVLLRNVDFRGSMLRGMSYYGWTWGEAIIESNDVKRITSDGKDCYIFKVRVDRYNKYKVIDYIVHIDRHGFTFNEWLKFTEDELRDMSVISFWKNNCKEISNYLMSRTVDYNESK